MEFYYHDVDHGTLILSADGGLNADNADEFVAGVETLLDAGVARIVVDCSKLNYISSRGVAILLGLHHRMEKRGGDVHLAGAKGVVPQIIHTLGLDGVFAMHPDVERALLAFRPRADPPAERG